MPRPKSVNKQQYRRAKTLTATASSQQQDEEKKEDSSHEANKQNTSSNNSNCSSCSASTTISTLLERATNTQDAAVASPAKAASKKRAALASAKSPSSASSSSSFLTRAAGFTLSGLIGRVTKASGMKSTAAAAQQKKPPPALTTNVTPLSERVNQCWVCHVALQVPKDQVLYYTRHVHPIFPPLSRGTDDKDSDTDEDGVVASANAACVCAVCAEDLVTQDKKTLERANASSNETERDEDEEVPDVCALCLVAEGEGCDDTTDPPCFFLCDKCPRAVCQTCVATCHGGGSAGMETMLQEKNATDESWACPVCQPPAALVQQAPLETNANSNKTADQVITRLCYVEEAYKVSNDKLDCEDAQKREIMKELHLEDGDEGNLEFVEEELELWRQDLTKHIERLLDTISQLQDELELVHGVDLSALYDYFKREDFLRPAELKDDPLVLQAADEACKLRQQQEDEEKKVPVFDVQLEDDYEGVEDLDLNLGNNEAPILPQYDAFKSIQARPDPKKVQRAMEMEDEDIRGKVKITMVSEKDDISVEQKREKKRSARPCLGEFRSVVTKKTSKSNKRPRREYQPQARDGKEEGPEKKKRAQPKREFIYSESSSQSVVHIDSPASSSAPAAAATKRRAKLTTIQSHVSSSLFPVQEKEIPEMFRRSSLKLARAGKQKVSIARDIASKLQPHQKEAIKFMWQTVFGDHLPEPQKPVGCLLSHHMGLGKSLSAISLCQAVVVWKIVRTVLLVVPVNTLDNWQNEFSKWINHEGPVTLDWWDLKDATNPKSKSNMINTWIRRGGVLMTSPRRLANLLDPSESKEVSESDADVAQKLRKADLLVVDEAHQCLSNPDSGQSKALHTMETTRKILLTGTPLQNNLTEYYWMLNFLSPGLLGKDLPEFENEFATPIYKGMPSDCSRSESVESLRRSRMLESIASKFVHRKDISELADVLPSMQQVVLHVRPTALQTKIFRWHKQFQARTSKNFFAAFQALKPILNHPASLLYRQNQTKNDDTSDNEETTKIAKRWWDNVRAMVRTDDLMIAENGLKIVLALHILVLCRKRNEKVLIFSQCLKTLDLLEEILSRPNWLDEVPTLSSLLANEENFGDWQKDRDFVRIDGSSDASQRGASIDRFNTDPHLTAFLISSYAGGCGINLVSSRRVILFDTPFNPTISDQAVARAYRYGQKQDVFVYRFLTGGSMEEKVYARTVSKSGLASRVIDKKNVARCYSKREMEDLQENWVWVQCDKCGKWRVPLGLQESEDLADDWTCSMNPDKQNNSCDIPERSQLWYESLQFQNEATDADEGDDDSAVAGSESDSEQPSLTVDEQKELEEKDDVLQHLLSLTEDKKGSKIVSKRVFHDVLHKPDIETPQKKTPEKSANRNTTVPTRSSSRKKQPRADAASPTNPDKPVATSRAKRNLLTGNSNTKVKLDPYEQEDSKPKAVGGASSKKQKAAKDAKDKAARPSTRQSNPAKKPHEPEVIDLLDSSSDEE